MIRCNECVKMQCIDSTCQKCKSLTEFDSLMAGNLTELPKGDLGAVSVEEKQALWPNEERIDIIGSNGNDGAAYDREEKIMAELEKLGFIEPKSGRAITFIARNFNQGSGD